MDNYYKKRIEILTDDKHLNFKIKKYAIEMDNKLIKSKIDW